MSSELWMKFARAEVGVHEVGNNGGPDVARYIRLAHCGALGDPWCAIFANAAFESNGIPGTRSPSSQSFVKSPAFVPINHFIYGAVAVFWRGDPHSGLGHVGFATDEHPDMVRVLGGNEHDMVCEEWLPKHSATFGWRGYWWPRTVDQTAAFIRSGQALPVNPDIKVT